MALSNGRNLISQSAILCWSENTINPGSSTLFLLEEFKIIGINQEENKITVYNKKEAASPWVVTRHKQECVQYSNVQWPEDIENDNDGLRQK